jgi:cobyrinic acid a,c-diamide synthase
VVDEAFMDAVPGEPESLAGVRREGLLVIRSLTKTWSIPGLRAGYVVGDPRVVADLEAQQPPWSVSSPALAALEACVQHDATERALLMQAWRQSLVETLPLKVVGDPVTPFVLARGPVGLREALREQGFAVRRCDTFPGLDSTHLRIAVRPPEDTGPLVAAIEKALSWDGP